MIKKFFSAFEKLVAETNAGYFNDGRIVQGTDEVFLIELLEFKEKKSIMV